LLLRHEQLQTLPHIEHGFVSTHIEKEASSGCPFGDLFGGVALNKDMKPMARLSVLKNPLLLGFDEIERLIDQIAKGAGDGYPPYNIERLDRENGADCLRITLAVAGFTREQLEITVEDNQIMIRGKQTDDTDRAYLHRGIAARQFQKTFVLADGIQVEGADLANGLLTIDFIRPVPERIVKRVEIGNGSA